MLSQWQKIVTVFYIIYLKINTCEHGLYAILGVTVKLKKHKPSAPQTDNFLALHKPLHLKPDHYGLHFSSINPLEHPNNLFAKYRQMNPMRL